jgi:hypothetical protein
VGFQKCLDISEQSFRSGHVVHYSEIRLTRQ